MTGIVGAHLALPAFEIPGAISGVQGFRRLIALQPGSQGLYFVPTPHAILAAGPSLESGFERVANQLGRDDCFAVQQFAFDRESEMRTFQLSSPLTRVNVGRFRTFLDASLLVGGEVLIHRFVGERRRLRGDVLSLGWTTSSFRALSHDPIRPQEMVIVAVQGLPFEDAEKHEVEISANRRTGIVTRVINQRRRDLVRVKGSRDFALTEQLQQYRQRIVAFFDHTFTLRTFPYLRFDSNPASITTRFSDVLIGGVRMAGVGLTPFGPFERLANLIYALQYLSNMLGQVEVFGGFPNAGESIPTFMRLTYPGSQRPGPV